MDTDYSALGMTELVDLLSQHTMKYTELLNKRVFNEEYQESKKVIQLIIAEMDRRKQNSATGAEFQND